MRVLVCGSRDWRRPGPIRDRLARLPDGTEILHGGARGADSLAAGIACGLGFRVTEFAADWKRYGGRAGYLRNVAMVEERPDLVLAFWQNESTGTGHTIREAAARGIPTEVFR